MGKKSRTSVLKRQREIKKAEKAAQKKLQRAERGDEPDERGGGVASQDDLAGYGLAPEPSEEEEEA